jgi:hypothetical protein
VTLTERRDPTIDTALEALTDTRLTIEDRGAAYAVLYAVQLRLNRALRKVKDELIVYMKSNDLKALGPLTVKSTPFDVEWPVNQEANWGDFMVQDTIRDVLLPIAPEFIRKVPAHYEIRTAELGKAIHLGDPLAIALHRELKARGWRTEAGRRLSLEVKEAK